MSDLTGREASTVLKLLFTAFPYANEKILEGTIRLYIAFLKCIPYQTGQAAALKIISNHKFFPTIAEIKEAVQQLSPLSDDLAPAEVAWEEVRQKLDPYKVPVWSNALISRAVKIIGYRNLCDGTMPNSDMTRFMRIYDTLRQREVNRIENEAIAQVSSNVAGVLGQLSRDKERLA